MELIKSNWISKDKKEFINHLDKFKRNQDKQIWEKKIINTDYVCLAILTKDIQTITKEISKGNFLSFLDLQIYDNFSAITIMGNLICKIKDFHIMKQYLDKYSEKIDNWANCDQLKFDINKSNKKDFLNLANEYIISHLPFRRRIAIIIMFKLINEKEINIVFSLANSLYSEEDYYVNMANAWLLCECFIKCRKQTLEFLKTHNLNKFTLNKMISKCCDSFRVPIEDKTLLKQLKMK
jgi:3-methyladenine DNA glycosylase AlkD